MHLLESGDQFPPTIIYTDDSLNQLSSAGGIDYDSNRKGTSALAGEVSMTALTLRKSSSATKAPSAQISTSSTIRTPISKLSNSDLQKKSDSLKSKNRVSSNSSICSNGTSVNPLSSSIMKSKDKERTGGHSRESIDFVHQISGFLTLDGIKSVVDKIHIALDKEKEELIMRMNQLEHKMEGDCEVIITCRSSNNSTPRVSEKVAAYNNNHSIDSNSNSIRCSPGGSRVESNGGSGADSRSIGKTGDKDSRIILGSCKVPGACDVCGARLTSQTEVMEVENASRGQDTSSSSSIINTNNNNSSSSSCIRGKSKTDHGSVMDQKELIRMQERVFQCNDCKSKKRREKIIGNRPLPEKSPSATTYSTIQKGCVDREGNTSRGSDTSFNGDLDSISALPGDSSKNGYKVDNNSSSKFRNRLQAARDEHHFIADDHFLR